MTADAMGYDRLTQTALRGVVRAALTRAAESGLPGAHHFFITFRTDARGVDLDDSLRAEYPQDMTIVIQHQFQDLEVDDVGFEVTLRFKGVPKWMRIPFAAVTMFHDPSVNFALRFIVDEAEIEGEADSAAPAESETPDPPADAGAAVVSLDAFRKKT